MRFCGTPPKLRTTSRRRSSTATAWRSSSLHDRQHIAGIHRGALGNKNILDRPPLGRLDLVLHFHRFNHKHPVSGLDLGSPIHQHADNLARHGGRQFPGTVIVRRPNAAAQRSRIANFCRKAGASDPEMLVACNAFALHFVGFVADAEREDVRPRQHRVHLDRATVEAAQPAPFGALKLEPVILAVDDDFVSHLIASRRAALFQWEAAFEALPDDPSAGTRSPGPAAAGPSTANMPAAITATSTDAGSAAESDSTSCFCFNIRSRKPVSSLAERKSGWRRIRRKSEILVLIPPTKYSFRARVSRPIA